MFNQYENNECMTLTDGNILVTGDLGSAMNQVGATRLIFSSALGCIMAHKSY